MIDTSVMASGAVASRVSVARPPPRVLILGGDSDCNLGDRAILEALCLALTRAERGMRITITSGRSRSCRLPGVVKVVPRGVRGFPALLREIAGQDLILAGGGGLFQDDDSRVKMPYWAMRLKLISQMNPRLVGHALGAGPLRHRESREFARLACGALRSVSVRDGFAHGCLSPCTDKPVSVVPDPAFMLPPAAAAAADTCLRRLGLAPGRPLIGVALRRWFHRRGGFLPHRLRSALALDRGDGAAEMAAFLDQAAQAVRALAARLGAGVLLLPSYAAAHEGDAQACRRLAERMPDVETRLAVLREPRLYKAVCGRLTLMLAARMHPLILAAGMGVPVVGMGYNGKFEGLFDMLALPHRLIRLDEFRGGFQADRLLALAESALGDGARLQRRCELLAARSQKAAAMLLAPSAVALEGAG